MAAFEAARFNHSRTSPFLVVRSAHRSFGAGREGFLVSGVVNRSENQIVTGIVPILSSYRGLLRLRASRRFRSGFRLRAPSRLAGSRPQPGSSFGGIEKTMSRLPSTDPPEL